MSSPPTPTRFEPEVLALLGEIARSPKGRLLRVPRERLRSYFGDPRETLTPHGSFLSKAERHLVNAYREQAARVLLEACHAKLQDEGQVVRTVQYEEEVLGRRARTLSTHLPEDFSGTKNPLIDVEGLSATELAVASARLAPRDATVNALAVCYQDEGWLHSSLRVLARFHDMAVSNEQRANGFSNMARAHSLRGEFARAFQYGHRACLLDEKRARLAVWCLTDALQGGDEEGALLSSKHLEERAKEQEVTAAAQLLVATRMRGTWTPTPEGARLAGRLRTALPPASGAICEVFV